MRATGGQPTLFVNERRAIRDRQSYAYERLVVDAARCVFVTDRYDHSIKKFSSGGQFQTRFGLGEAQWRWTPAVAVDASGNFYVTDSANNRIMKFAPSWKRL